MQSGVQKCLESLEGLVEIRCEMMKQLRDQNATSQEIYDLRVREGQLFRELRETLRMDCLQDNASSTMKSIYERLKELPK